ncbi:MAG: BPSS1780 family membrane protein [Casimicrobiaceae bacterium]
MPNPPNPGVPRPGTPAPDARPVEAGRGAAWWSEAWRLFTPAAGVWIVIVIVAFILNIVLALIPLLGHVAGQLLFPIFAGGLMLGCRAIDRGEPLTVAHLFAGFGNRLGPLFIVGLIYTAIAVAIILVVFGLLVVFFGAAIVGHLWHMQHLDPFAIGSILGDMLVTALVIALIFLLLYLPLLMAVWFAPALVVLRGVDPLEAMRLSFNGSLRNVVPFLIYGLIGLGLAIVATIPLGLGWLVLGPVTITSLYASYCDIYEDLPPAPGEAPPQTV